MHIKENSINGFNDKKKIPSIMGNMIEAIKPLIQNDEIEYFKNKFTWKNKLLFLIVYNFDFFLE